MDAPLTINSASGPKKQQRREQSDILCIGECPPSSFSWWVFIFLFAKSKIVTSYEMLS